MDKFVVSARKYRPSYFEEVIGQDHITKTLINAVKNNHLGQALLFCGPRGVGKTTCARILAKVINGFDDNNENLSSNFNIFEIDAASHNSVDDIRRLIEQVRYPPQNGKYKVYIIDEVHMLTTQAFNAFLKTLEEPPEYVIFILATTEKQKIIPTILSRCQIFDFNKIQIQDIIKQLEKIAKQENIETESEALYIMAQKSDGALRDALSLFDLIATFSNENKITYQNTIQNLYILDYDFFFAITDALYDEKFSEVLLIFDEILSKGFEGIHFLVGLQKHFRDLLVSKNEETLKLLEVVGAIKEKYLQQGKKIEPSFLLSGLNILNHSEIHYKSSKNQKLHVELCLMKLTYLKQATSISELPSPLKKKAQ